MEDIKIDSETAILILKAYQKIYKLNGLLHSKPYTQISEFKGSGSALHEMMNNAFKESTSSDLQAKLTMLSHQVKNLLGYSQKVKNVKEHKQITNLFETLVIDITLIQSKINAVK